MKTTHTKHTVMGRPSLLRWAAFIAALCSMIASVAVLTGWRSDKLAKLRTGAPIQGQYYAGTVDMSQLFRMH